MLGDLTRNDPATASKMTKTVSDGTLDSTPSSATATATVTFYADCLFCMARNVMLCVI